MLASPAAADPALAPIVLELVVPCSPDRAFDYFTRDIGKWWPLATHSLGEADSIGLRFEPRVGGRLVETVRDGREHAWGAVTTWRPGERIALSWHLDRDPTTAQWIVVEFNATPAGTRVVLTHGGWEKLPEGGAAMRANYARGWPKVFSKLYGAFCAAPEDAGSPPPRG